MKAPAWGNFVTKVFQAVCYRAPLKTDGATISTLKSQFVSGGYKLKSVFQQAVAGCAGS